MRLADLSYNAVLTVDPVDPASAQFNSEGVCTGLRAASVAALGGMGPQLQGGQEGQEGPRKVDFMILRRLFELSLVDASSVQPGRTAGAAAADLSATFSSSLQLHSPGNGSGTSNIGIAESKSIPGSVANGEGASGVSGASGANGTVIGWGGAAGGVSEAKGINPSSPALTSPHGLTLVHWLRTAHLTLARAESYAQRFERLGITDAAGLRAAVVAAGGLTGVSGEHISAFMRTHAVNEDDAVFVEFFLGLRTTVQPPAPFIATAPAAESFLTLSASSGAATGPVGAAAPSAGAPIIGLDDAGMMHGCMLLGSCRIHCCCPCYWLARWLLECCNRECCNPSIYSNS